MNTLIVYAHPNPRSFNAALRDVAVETLSQAGHAVVVSDLYAMRFDPVLQTPEIGGTLRPDAQAEVEKVRRADLLLFQFPDWWYGMPAILKGWIERIFAYGFAYDETHEYETGLLRGKKAMLSLTVGAPPEYFRQAPQRELMRVLEPIHYGYFAFVGIEVLPPFIVYGPSKMSEAERKKVLEEYREYLREIPRLEPLRF